MGPELADRTSCMYCSQQEIPPECEGQEERAEDDGGQIVAGWSAFH